MAATDIRMAKQKIEKSSCGLVWLAVRNVLAGLFVSGTDDDDEIFGGKSSE